jgi:hypothetical protein
MHKGDGDDDDDDDNNNKHVIIIFIFAAGHTAQQNEVHEVGAEHAAKPVNTFASKTQCTSRNLRRLHQSFPLTCIAVLCFVLFHFLDGMKEKGRERLNCAAGLQFWRPIDTKFRLRHELALFEFRPLTCPHHFSPHPTPP